MSERVGVLFDVDGTLVDSNYFHAIAWWRALRDDGEHVAIAAIHRLVGMGADRLLEDLIGHNRPEVAEARGRYFKEYLREVPAFPAAGDLLREVSRRGGKVVLASSGEEDEVSAVRDAIGADDVVDHATTSADAETSKPAPDIFRAAMKGAGLTPPNAIVVGDTVWDVEAALGCGLRCVAVLTGGIARAALKEAGAVAVYRDVAELLERLDDSPLGALLGVTSR